MCKEKNDTYFKKTFGGIVMVIRDRIALGAFAGIIATIP
jgi:hypothetical protein